MWLAEVDINIGEVCDVEGELTGAGSVEYEMFVSVANLTERRQQFHSFTPLIP